MVIAASLHAAALTEARDTTMRNGSLVSLTVKDAEIIYAGAIVCVDTNGEALNADDTASLKVVGRAESTVDNTDDGEAITVGRAVYNWDNGGSFTAADIGSKAYVQDNQTVTTAAAASNDVVVGYIVDVDSDGVWVDVAERRLFDVAVVPPPCFSTGSGSGTLLT